MSCVYFVKGTSMEDISSKNTLDNVPAFTLTSDSSSSLSIYLSSSNWNESFDICLHFNLHLSKRYCILLLGLLS